MIVIHAAKGKGLFLRWVIWSVLLLWTCRSYAESFISPPGSNKGPIRVELGVFILSLDEVNTASQNFSANVYLVARWHDARLAHDGNDIIRRSRIEVWNPQIYIINQQMIYTTLPDVVDILPTGEVIYRQRFWGSFSQTLDLKEFPFDRQRLNIQIVSASFDNKDIELVPLEMEGGRKSGIAKDVSLPDWKVLDWNVKTEPYIPMETIEGIPGFVFSINISRHTTDFFLKVICPLLFIIAMSWVAFFIHPEEVATIIFIAGTSVFTLVVYLFTVNQMIPEVSYITRMDKILLMSIAAVFLSLIQTVIIVRYVKQGNTQLAKRIANWTRILYPVIFLFIGIWILFF